MALRKKDSEQAVEVHLVERGVEQARLRRPTPGGLPIGPSDRRLPLAWPAPARAGRTIAGLLALVLAACAGDSDPPAAPTAEATLPRPNVLLISIDTLRADHLDAYGYDRTTAPNLSRLADEGALFESCVAVSNWTLPTHTSLFTGLHPLVHGVEEHKDQLDPGRATLGEAFAAAGYETAGWFSNPFVGSRFGFTRGFESWTMAPNPDEMRQQIEKQGTPKGAISRSWQPEPGTRAVDYFVEQSAEPITQRGLQFLEQRDVERPFLLFLHYNDVHSDYIPPPPFDRRFSSDYSGSLSIEGYPHNKRVNRAMPAEDLAWVVSQYDGEIGWVDQHIGTLLQRLADLDLAENTIVIVTADHGEGFYEHNGKEHHYGLYHELVQIPFIVRYPARVDPGQRITHGVSQTDIAPTLLGLAGVEGLPEADGLSWAAVLTGGSGPRPRPLLSRAVLKPILEEQGDLVLSLRTPTLTIIRRTSPEGAQQELVFDRSADPGETTPLRHGHPDHARGLALLALIEGRMAARRDSLPWSDDQLLLEEDPELLKWMRQMGYIR
jgi:arylsulfatase A-like enzyme